MASAPAAVNRIGPDSRVANAGGVGYTVQPLSARDERDDDSRTRPPEASARPITSL